MIVGREKAWKPEPTITKLKLKMSPLVKVGFK